MQCRNATARDVYLLQPHVCFHWLRQRLDGNLHTGGQVHSGKHLPKAATPKHFPQLILRQRRV